MSKKGTGWIPDYPDLSDYSLDSAEQKLSKKTQNQDEKTSLETLAQKVFMALDALADLPIYEGKKNELNQLKEALETEVLSGLEFITVDFHDVLKVGSVDEEVLTIRGYLNFIKNKYSDFLTGEFYDSEWYEIFSSSDDNDLAKGSKYYSVDYTNRRLTQDMLIFVSKLLGLQVTYLFPEDAFKFDANILEAGKKVDCIGLDEVEYLKFLSDCASNNDIYSLTNSWDDFLSKVDFLKKDIEKPSDSKNNPDFTIALREKFLENSSKKIKLVAYLNVIALREKTFSKVCQKFDKEFIEFYKFILNENKNGFLVSFNRLKELWLQVAEPKKLLDKTIKLALEDFSEEIGKAKSDRATNALEDYAELDNLNDIDRENDFSLGELLDSKRKIEEIEKDFIKKLANLGNLKAVLPDDPRQQGRDFSQIQKKLEMLFASDVDIEGENSKLKLQELGEYIKLNFLPAIGCSTRVIASNLV